MRVNIFPVLCAVFLLSGCSFVSNTISGVGTDNTPPPSPLIPIQTQLPIQSVWTIQASGSAGIDYLKLGPVIADNRIFTADAKGAVAAFDVRYGKRVWATNAKARITSGPSVGNGIVVVGTADGKAIAFREDNGAILWRVVVPNVMLTAPAIAQGYVVIKTIDGKLCGLSAQTGQVLWQYDHGAPPLVVRHGGMPQIVGNKVIAGFSDGKLGAYGLTQGNLLWEQTIASPQGLSETDQLVDIVGDPVVANGVVYVATYQDKVSAINIATGEVLWQQNISSTAGLTVSSRLVFVTDDQGIVWALNRATGDLVWKQNQLLNRVLTAPVLVNGYVAVGDGSGYVHWLSPQDGHFVARHLIESGTRILAPPIAMGNFLFVMTSRGNLSAWRVG